MAAAAENQVVALQLSELEAQHFMFSAKQTKKWDFFNKKTNKQTVGSNDFVFVYYGHEHQKLAFVIEDVKTSTGVQTTDSFKRGFMSVSLTPEQSKQVRDAVDKPLRELVWQHRADLVKNGRKMQQQMEMNFLYHGVVTDGKEKKDKEGNLQRGADGQPQCWNDSITADIPMKKKNQSPVVDENECQIVDPSDRPYAYTSLAGKTMKEVVVQVDKVVFSDKIRVHCSFKLIVPADDSSNCVKYTTKRRLEAGHSTPVNPPPAASAGAPSGATAPAASAPAPNPATTATATSSANPAASASTTPAAAEPAQKKARLQA